MKCRERMGSSLPPAELARRDSALFEKMKCIFSIAPVGNLEKSRECSSHRNTHRTLAAEAPDAEVVRPVCCGARVKHQTVNTGRRGAHVRASDAILLWPVCLTGSTGRSGSVRWCASGDLSVLQSSLILSPVSTGRSGAQRPVTLCFCRPLFV